MDMNGAKMDDTERKVARLGKEYEARLKALMNEFDGKIRREVPGAKTGALAAAALVGIQQALREVYGDGEMDAAYVIFDNWARDGRRGGLGAQTDGKAA